MAQKGRSSIYLLLFFCSCFSDQVLYICDVNMEDLSMATVTIEYDGRNLAFKKLLEVFVAMGAKVKPTKEKLSSVEISLKEAKQGKVTKCKDFNDFLEKINA